MYRNFNVEIPRSLRSLGMTDRRSVISSEARNLIKCTGISMFKIASLRSQ